MSNYYIGLLSGSSVDGVDCALIDFNDQPKMIATHHHPFPKELTDEIHHLSFPGNNEIERLGKADRQLGVMFAEGCNELLKKANLSANDISAIGSHGQNIRHRPQLDQPFSLQIGDPNIIATKTGITTVADFRRKDIALGGQGAPLVPLVHQALFHNDNRDRVILNIGGIANITFLPANKKSLYGFDTGPGNTLLDTYARQHLNKQYDDNGDWAASGSCQKDLLRLLLADEYFHRPAPKSTGREYFNTDWLQQFEIDPLKPEDLQATLVDLTANSIANAIRTIPADNPEIFVCGGGVHNGFLIERLTQLCAPYTVKSTNELNIDPDWVESLLFAWLAKQTIHHLPGNSPTVTGASRASILGGIYYP